MKWFYIVLLGLVLLSGVGAVSLTHCQRARGRCGGGASHCNVEPGDHGEYERAVGSKIIFTNPARLPFKKKGKSNEQCGTQGGDDEGYGERDQPDNQTKEKIQHAASRFACSKAASLVAG